MTINEIESTIDTLEKRHPNLDEATLTTLLTAGGWDDKTQKEAILIFKGRTHTAQALHQVPNAPEKLLPKEIDASHELLARNPYETANGIVDPQAAAKKVEQSITTPTSKTSPSQLKESLIIPEVSPKEEKDLPHNLPLRPFESAPHVWSFSRYKDVFHGEVMPSGLKPDERELAEKHATKRISIEPTPLAKKDEKLIFLAGLMLLVILLLLGYMYSNGRL